METLESKLFKALAEILPAEMRKENRVRYEYRISDDETLVLTCERIYYAGKFSEHYTFLLGQFPALYTVAIVSMNEKARIFRFSALHAGIPIPGIHDTGASATNYQFLIDWIANYAELKHDGLLKITVEAC